MHKYFMQYNPVTLCRDLRNINRYTILNIYRDIDSSKGDKVYDYITYLDPPTKCFINRDFNVYYDIFKPSIIMAHCGAKLAKWAAESGIDFISIPRTLTHKHKHIIDFTFLNMAFISTLVQMDIYYSLDYET
jgi:hypothetical protein